jgi:putative chitinase
MAFNNTLYNLWPSGDKLIPGLRDGIAASAPTVFKKYGFNSALVVAHFMAQVSLECGAGTEVVENLNYSPQRLPQVWPTHFNSSNAWIYAHNPQKLANYIYEPPIHNDLGNIAKSNDGWNFRGRGATQTTGRAGYTALQAALARSGVVLDLLKNPDRVNDPKYFLECGAADFVICGCLPWAKADNVVQVTKHLNGGYTGLADRTAWLARWKTALVGVAIL